MTKHYIREHVREHSHIGMPITTSTYVDVLEVPVGNVINQFNLGSKLVGITSDGGTNLATCKAILESTFDNTGVFDLENPMFVIKCLSHVLANGCKAVVMDVKSDYFRVDTEVTRRNMQCCIIWTKKSQKGSKALETAQNHVVLPCKNLITPVKNSFSCLIQSFRSLLENKGAINYLYGSI